MPISSGAGGTPTSYFRGKPDGKPQESSNQSQPQYVQRRGSTRIPTKTVKVVRVRKKRGCFKGMFRSQVWKAGHQGYSANAIAESGPVNCYGLGMCLLALLLLGLLAAIATAIYYAISASQVSQISTQLGLLKPGHQENDRFFYVANYNQQCVSRVTGNIVTVPVTTKSAVVVVTKAPTTKAAVQTTIAATTNTATTNTETTSVQTTTVKTTTAKTTTVTTTAQKTTTPALATTTLPFCDTITYTYTEVYPIKKSSSNVYLPSLAINTLLVSCGLLFK